MQYRLVTFGGPLQLFGLWLMEAQREAANQWLMTESPDLLPLLVAYDTKSAVFPSSSFSQPLLKLSPSLWWQGVKQTT